MSEFATTPDEYGDSVRVIREATDEVVDGTTTVVSVERTMIASDAQPGEWTILTEADRSLMAAAILGWPVDELTQVDPATHIVVERNDAILGAGYIEDGAVSPAVLAAAARLRAALGEDGAR